jgi:hypothetical protein
MSADIIALKPLPWLTAPKALLGVTVQLRTIIVRSKNIPDHYPYDHRILYRQFVGNTVPPNDVGDPGDIWILKKPDAYALYARSETEWMEWPGFRVLRDQLIPHPNLIDRYLSSSKSGFKWYAFSTIENEGRARGHSLYASEIVKAVLEMEVSRETGGNTASQSPRNPVKRKKVELSDDEADSEYRYESSHKRIKEEPESDIMQRSKVGL